MIITLQVVLLFLISVSLVFYLWSALCTVRFFAPVKGQLGNTVDQAASLLVPVCGLDEGAYENWAALCEQNYEHYEVLFGVMNPMDPAVPVLKELVTNFPERARFLLCLPVRGINYQFSNLMHLLEAAQHEVVIFVDSDMLVSPDYLRTVIAPLMNPEVGVVTCGYLGHTPKSLGAALASLGRCIDFIPSVLVARSLDGGLRFAFGATIATRKSVLAKIGGLQSVVNRVGADYQIGKMATDAGYRVELSEYILENDAGRETLRQVFNRELRWAKSIRCNRGLQYYGIGFTYGIIYCIPLLLVSGNHPWVIIVCLTTLFARVIQALVAINRLGCPNLFWWLWALPIRDLMSFGIWVRGMLGRGIYWRGRQLLIGPGGVLQEQVGSNGKKWVYLDKRIS
jgi:ceramide glucosyltransferase